jgi:hypothetical protein
LACGSADTTFYYALGQQRTLAISDSELVVKFDQAFTGDLDSFAVSAEFLDDAYLPNDLGSGFAVFGIADGFTFTAVAESLMAMSLVDMVNPVYLSLSGSRLIPTNEMVIKFADVASEAEIASFISSNGLTVVENGRFRSRVYVVRHDSEVPGSIVQVANDLYENSLTDWCHPNFVCDLILDSIPNDPLFSSQWNFRNIGQTFCYAGTDLSAELAWEITTGTPDVVVAMIDDGFQMYAYQHPDVDYSKFVFPHDFYPWGGDEDDNPDPCPASTHGMS